MASPDPLQVVEAWFAAALEDPALLPEGEGALGPEVSAYRLVRIFQQSPRQYFAIFALDGEPARTSALQVELMADDHGAWYVVDAIWAAPRGLWPRI